MTHLIHCVFSQYIEAWEKGKEMLYEFTVLAKSPELFVLDVACAQVPLATVKTVGATIPAMTPAFVSGATNIIVAHAPIPAFATVIKYVGRQRRRGSRHRYGS
jgi:hypothetical protein